MSYMNKDNKRKIIGILIILATYIHTFTFSGNKFLGSVYFIFHVFKIAYWIIGSFI